MKSVNPITISIACLVIAATMPLAAQGITLVDGTSSAVYDPTSPLGMTEWNVGGADHLTSQSFWVRQNGSDLMEVPLSGIYLSSSGSGNSVAASFGTADYSIDISYTLTELTIESAQITESIVIENLSGAELSLSFFQYNNFDLAANGGGDYVRILTDNLGSFSVAQQVEPGVSGLEEAAVQNNPGSVRAEVAYFDTILSKLSDGDIDDLSNSTGMIGPGDVEFAFQWDYSIADGGSQTISKVKTLDVTFVPEPASIGLALLGFGAIMLSRKRRV